MAITTVDGAIAGAVQPAQFAKALSGAMVAGRPYTSFYAAGIPGAAVAPSPGLAGAALTSYGGQIPFPAASNNTYLSRFSGVHSAQGGILYLCDRLWHNSGITITSTSPHTVDSATWPARDRAGSTNGDGVYIGVEVSATVGAGTPTLTIGYTNSAGVDTKTGTNVNATVAASILGTFHPIGLQAGDVGVRSVQTFTLSATWTSGTIHLVAYRILASLELSAAGIPNAVDALTSGFPRCYDNTVPFLVFVPQTTTTGLMTGSVNFAQG